MMSQSNSNLPSVNDFIKNSDELPSIDDFIIKESLEELPSVKEFIKEDKVEEELLEEERQQLGVEGLEDHAVAL